MAISNVFMDLWLKEEDSKLAIDTVQQAGQMKDYGPSASPNWASLFSGEAAGLPANVFSGILVREGWAGKKKKKKSYITLCQASCCIKGWSAILSVTNQYIF